MTTLVDNCSTYLFARAVASILKEQKFYAVYGMDTDKRKDIKIPYQIEIADVNKKNQVVVSLDNGNKFLVNVSQLEGK